MTLLERVLEHEGFESKPYPDPISGGDPYTFGHGLTYITEAESRRIVTERLEQLRDAMVAIHPWLSESPIEVLEVVVEMAFQMGIRGTNLFRKMWVALQRGDYETAADEMLDSRWAKQTPNRAKALSDIVRGCDA